MTQSMLERIARAMCAADRVDPEGWALVEVDPEGWALVGVRRVRCWEARLAAARAAVEAMREPSRQMLAAMPKPYTEGPHPRMSGHIMTVPTLAWSQDACWKAAIDAILSE